MTEYPCGTYIFILSIGYSSASRERTYDVADDFTEAEWGELSDSKKERHLADTANDWVYNCIDVSFELKEKT